MHPDRGVILTVSVLDVDSKGGAVVDPILDGVFQELMRRHGDHLTNVAAQNPRVEVAHKRPHDGDQRDRGEKPTSTWGLTLDGGPSILIEAIGPSGPRLEQPNVRKSTGKKGGLQTRGPCQIG